MLKNKMSINPIALTGIIVCFFVLSYARHTFYINPNLSGDTIFIRINDPDSYLNAKDDLENWAEVSNITIGKSIIVFWILFGFLKLSLGEEQDRHVRRRF